MKNHYQIVFYLAMLLAIGSCCKDPDGTVLPDKVELGETVVFLNGDLVEYAPEFVESTVHDIIAFGFVQSKNQGQLENLLAFGSLPVKEGEYKLTTKKENDDARTSFAQTINEDEEGYEYELKDADEGYFKIDLLDQAKKEVKGSFKAKFCRKSKNGNKDLGLPKTLLFQGVFYENYTSK